MSTSTASPPFDSTVRDSSGAPLTATDATSQASAWANQLQSSTIMAAQLNNNLKSIYLTAFSNWCISVNAGRVSNANPPAPPVRYVVSSPDAHGYQWPIIDPAGTPVCDIPPIPADHSLSQAQIAAQIGPNVADVGHNISGNWYACGAKNTFNASSTPDGKTPPIVLTSGSGGPADNGLPHIFQFYAAPVGPGWYLLIS